MRTLPAILVFALLVAPLWAEEDGGVTRISPTTITPTRTPRAVESLTGSVEIVDRDEFQLRDVWTMDEALAEVPGVDVVGDSRYGQEVRLNTRGIPSGYGTQRTLVLLDGRPLTDEYLGNVDLAQYPLSAMRRVELVRGPSSSAYGTNALGGLLNLLPARGTAEPRAELFATGGSFGTRRGGASWGGMAGPVDLFLAGESLDTEGYLNNSGGDDMDWQTWSGFANVGLEGERYEVRSYLSYFDGEGTDEDYDRDLDRNMQDLKASFDLDPESEAVATLRVYRSQLDQTLAWFQQPATDFDLVSWGAILTQSWRVHADHLVTGGAEWRRESAEVSEAAGDVDQVATTWSGFLQDEVDLTETLHAVFGLRWDDRSEIDGELSWRAGANWKAAEGTTVRGAVGRAYRAPTISDQYLPTTSYFGLTFMGNPDLEPEVLRSGELGLDQRLLDDPGLDLSVTGFLSRFKDFWDFLPGTDGVFRPMNIGGVKIWGVEALLSADLGEGFTAETGYTFTNAKYVKFQGDPSVEGNRLDDNVRHAGSAALTWRHPDGHAARLAVVATGNRFTDPQNSHDGKLDAFYLVELQVRVQVTDWAALTLNVQNALNHGYRTRPEFRQPRRAIFFGILVTP